VPLRDHGTLLGAAGFLSEVQDAGGGRNLEHYFCGP
jgi:hypothetical protein